MPVIRKQRAIAASDLPPESAMDAEFQAADAAHVAAADPHTQYLLPSEADARYGLIKKIIFTATTATTEGAFIAIAHGLIFSKIAAINAIVEHSGGLVTQSHTFTAGYEFSLSANSTNLYVGNVASKSANILGKPVKVVVDYMI